MLKALTVATSALVAGLLAVPLLAGGDNRIDVGCVTTPAIARILATIRYVESAGRYDLPANAGGASGAYQYIDTTWRTWAAHAGVDTTVYPHAYLAPAAVQDAVASDNVASILHDHPDITAVPVAWYWPRALDHPEDLDIVPVPSAGNRLTVRQYQQHWVTVYQHHGETGPPTDTATTTEGVPIAGCLDPMPGLAGPAAVVISFAVAQLGKPYVFDTEGPDTYDCSGLTRAAYRQIRINLPHYTGSQVHMGTPVDWHTQTIQSGDLVFIRGGSPPEDYGHVGIALDPRRWINAPHTGDVVKIADMPAAERIQAVRRFLTVGPTDAQVAPPRLPARRT